VADREAGMNPYVFMTRVIVSESLERNRYVQKEAKQPRAKYPSVKTPEKMSIQSMPSYFETQRKSVNSLMQRPSKVKNVQGKGRKIEAATVKRRNAARDRDKRCV